MADFFLRYQGEFMSVGGIRYRAEIWQHAPEPYPSVGILTFEAEEAVVISYPETPKEEAVCGSCATLRIESPGDRTYADLYTITPGEIRLRLYRDGVLYWTGTLDPEMYEEPYERARFYEVALSFSDFGSLERKPYALEGVRSLREIIDHALSEAGIEGVEIDQSMISTVMDADYHSPAPLRLEDIAVRSDNFYDEDGEPTNLRDVLTGALQPLGLRIVQRGGKIYVYDLNGLYNAPESVEAEWDGDSSTLGVDVVYNNAKITWSPYPQTGNLAPETCWTEEIDEEATDRNAYYGECRIVTYHLSTDLHDWNDPTDTGFSLWTSLKGENATLNTDRYPQLRFFKIVPHYDGEESEGVAIFWNTFSATNIGENRRLSKFPFGDNQFYRITPAYISGQYSNPRELLFSSEEVWLPPVEKPSDIYLRIGLNVLFDPRFNPFEQAEDLTKEAEKTWQAQYRTRVNFMYVPVMITFRPDGSDEVYYWECPAFSTAQTWGVYALPYNMGRWRLLTPQSKPRAYLAYYKPSDRKEDTAIGQGWAMNRQLISPHFGRISTWLEKCPDGQYIPYPGGDPFAGGEMPPTSNLSGRLRVEVYAGWVLADGGVDIPGNIINDPHEVWSKSKVNWIMCQLPEIEIVRSDLLETKIPDDDIEYSAELHPDAKDPIELNTICGSAVASVPTARGAYLRTSDQNQISSLTRAGRAAAVEELLIGTLYSQYAQRRTKLSGEIRLIPGGVAPITEQNQPGSLFILTGEEQNLITDTSEATLIELRPDEYDKDNGEEDL